MRKTQKQNLWVTAITLKVKSMLSEKLKSEVQNKAELNAQYAAQAEALLKIEGEIKDKSREVELNAERIQQLTETQTQ